MNYIKNLEQSNQEKHAAMELATAKIHEFRAHLQTAKFTGVDHNGERLDWIATKDVDSMLLQLAAALWT